jgi:hypothetical protein
MNYCGCLRNDKGEFGLRLKEIWDEVVEVCEAGSWEELKDEVSDVMFGFGRLLGYMCGRVYVKMWFDERHVKKIEGRVWMCEKQETSGEWCVSVGRESVDWKGK